MGVTLIAYDIDGTLITTGGAGRSALNRAFFELHGVKEGFREVSFAGRTDPGIVAEAFFLAGRSVGKGDLDRLKTLYLACLERELAERGSVLVHPGVQEALAGTDACGVNCLLTGNWREGAQRKLEAAELWGHFSLGAFGNDSPCRDDLVPVLRARAAQRGLDVERVVVIGDTESDVACARAGDALAVAVGTGWRTEEELLATEPDLFLADLEGGLERLLSLLGDEAPEGSGLN